MTTQADTIISIALAEVGYLEKASNANLDNKTANAGYNNWTKYGVWYANNVAHDSTYSNAYWCDMFKTWCANKAGVTSDQIPYTAYCPTGVNWFKNKGLWHASGSYTPKKGDVIYYKDSTGIAGHVGLVYQVSGGRVYTVEGNTSATAGVVANGGAVAKKSYSLTYSRILGYGSPLYKEDLSKAEVTSLINSLAPSLIKTEINKYFDELADIADLSNWAKEEGFMPDAIAAGITDGTSPQMFMKREEFAAIIMRYMAKIPTE